MVIYIYTALIILYIVSKFILAPILAFSVGIAAMIALVISFFRARGLYLISGICFFTSGVFLFIYNGLPWYTFLLHFESMLGVLSLFLVLPFINSLIRVGRYDKNLSMLLQQGVTDLNKLYRRSSLVCHFLGLFLNIATLPLLTNSLNQALNQFPKKISEKFYAQNLLRAYALCLTWSPMEVMVSTSIDITKSSYFHVFPIMLSLAIITIISDWILSAFKYKNTPLVIEEKTGGSFKEIYKKIREMLVLLIIFILLVSLLQHILNKGFLFSVVLVLMPISIVWAFFIGKIDRYFLITIPHWKERTEGLSNYFFMFLSAGLFVEMLSLSGHLAFLQSAFGSVTEKPLLLYLMIGAYFLFTSLTGFHPLVSITLLAELLHPILLEISSISLTIVLISCSLSTVMYSPYNLSVSILADQLKINSYKMGMWNLSFAAFYMVVSILIAYAIKLIS